MRKRTQAREFALQVLYQWDIRKREDARMLLSRFWLEHPTGDDVRQFANQLVLGVTAAVEDLDRRISRHADNWDLNRMAVVDRNILRMGAFELTGRDDTPASVCINEAIELGKRYGDADSAKFINGVLDAIHKSGDERRATSDETKSSDG